MAVWKKSEDPFFYRCSDCGSISDWRDETCENCGAKMEDTEDLIVEVGDYKGCQCGGNLNYAISKKGKMVFHAINTERMTREELTKIVEEFPEFQKTLRELQNNRGSKKETKKAITIKQRKEKKRLARAKKELKRFTERDRDYRAGEPNRNNNRQKTFLKALRREKKWKVEAYYFKK